MNKDFVIITTDGLEKRDKSLTLEELHEAKVNARLMLGYNIISSYTQHVNWDDNVIAVHTTHMIKQP
jgi:hypothetical protein